jgi:hypothetical protein
MSWKVPITVVGQSCLFVWPRVSLCAPNRQPKQDNTTDTITDMAAVVSTNPAHAASDETSDLSKQYDTPLGLAHTTMQALKDRIKLHYDLASE